MQHPPSRTAAIGSTTYDPASVHYNRRGFDDRYEVVARAEVLPDDWRYVVLDIRPNRLDALERVRELRAYSDTTPKKSPAKRSAKKGKPS